MVGVAVKTSDLLPGWNVFSFTEFCFKSVEFSKHKTYTCIHWLTEFVSPSQRGQRIAEGWSSWSVAWALVNVTSLSKLKRELGSETQMTEERSRSPGQKLVQKQLSDFCQCLETGALIAVSCNANHPACHTSSKICFAPVFLFPRPEYCGLSLSHSL